MRKCLLCGAVRKEVEMNWFFEFCSLPSVAWKLRHMVTWSQPGTGSHLLASFPQGRRCLYLEASRGQLWSPQEPQGPGLYSGPHVSPPSKRARSGWSLLGLSTLEVVPLTTRKGGGCHHGLGRLPGGGVLSWVGVIPKLPFPKGSSLAQCRERPLNHSSFFFPL